MSVQSVSERFVELCNEGKNFEVMRTLYAPNIVSVEGDGETGHAGGGGRVHGGEGRQDYAGAVFLRGEAVMSLATMARCAVAAAGIVVAGCGQGNPASAPPDPASPSQAGFVPDMGPGLHELDRPASWSAKHMSLGSTGFTASIGPVRDMADRSRDYYSIDVEKRGVTASYVYFQRDFRLADVPPALIDAPIEDVVTFDPVTRTVEFDIGERRERYVLPDVP